MNEITVGSWKWNLDFFVAQEKEIAEMDLS